jgi:hypothetical protein
MNDGQIFSMPSCRRPIPGEIRMDFPLQGGHRKDISTCRKYDFAGTHISLAHVRIVYSHATKRNAALQR